MRLYTDKVSPGIHGCHTSPFSSPELFTLSRCFSSWKALFALFVAEYLPLIRSSPTKGTPRKKISEAPNLPRLQLGNPLIFISLQKPCFCLPPQANTYFPVHPSAISISNHHHGRVAGAHHTSAHGASREASPTSNENALQLLPGGHEVPFVFLKKMVIINHNNKPLTLSLKRGGLQICPSLVEFTSIKNMNIKMKWECEWWVEWSELCRRTSVTRTRRGQQTNNETEGKVRNANEHEHECQNCDSKRYDWGETTLNIKNTERWRLKVPKRICTMALNAEMNDGSKHLKIRKMLTSNAWMGMKNGSERQTKEKKMWH